MSNKLAIGDITLTILPNAHLMITGFWNAQILPFSWLRVEWDDRSISILSNDVCAQIWSFRDEVATEAARHEIVNFLAGTSTTDV